MMPTESSTRDRRHVTFISCTNWLTIISDIPYDRSQTSMACHVPPAGENSTILTAGVSAGQHCPSRADPNKQRRPGIPTADPLPESRHRPETG